MSTALANIQERIKQELANVKQTVAAPSGRTISVKGKVFTLPNGQSSQGPMQAVVLDWRNLNRYYTAAYNPQNPAPPHCFALHKDINLLAPHEEAAEPQADDCASCAMNKWGSAPAGGKGKACRNTVRLAIAPPDMTAEDEPYLISVSPTGIKSWSALVNGLEAHGMLPIQVVTEISFDPNAAYPSLVFKPMQPHDKLDVFWLLREKAQTMLDLPLSSD